MAEEPHLSAAASLVHQLDKRLLVLLRDGRQYIGILRSFDQFSNVVLSNAVERVVEGRAYADLPLGLYLVRGENVILMGDLDHAEAGPPPLEGHQKVSEAEIRQAQKAAKAAELLKGGAPPRRLPAQRTAGACRCRSRLHVPQACAQDSATWTWKDERRLLSFAFPRPLFADSVESLHQPAGPVLTRTLRLAR